MMNSLPHLSQPLIGARKFRCARLSPFRFALTLTLLFFATWTSAQTVTWTDSFERGVAPSTVQCNNWSSFLDELGGKSFISVTISGTFDQGGKTLSDPVAATQLALLLSSRTAGTVESGGHTWTVTRCQLSACADATESFSIALSYDGNTTECDCDDTYAIRPQSTNGDWGGVNVASSCNAVSQTMKLEFNSGVSISVNGSTTLCEGSSVELTANSEICSAPLNYLWSNGATTQTITVGQPGSYSVTVADANGCGGTSETVIVTMTDISVNAGADATYCDEAVQLDAIGASGSGSGSAANAVCIYNSPGGVDESDCAFTTDVCLEGATFVGNSNYSADAAFSNPVELRYNVYYSAFNLATFRFKLNNQELGSFDEFDPTGVCETPEGTRFPRSMTFQESQFKQYWIDGGMNELRVEIETANGGVYLAGITAEVITSNETYSWSPLAGLSNASIRNPLASPSVSTVYTVTYTDANGCSATDQVEVKVNCAGEAPVAVCHEVTIALEEGCEANVAAGAFDGGSTTSSGGTLSFTASPAGPYPVGVTDVELTVTDSNGGSATCTTKITVTDPVLPVIATPADLVVENDPGTCSATLALVAPESSDNCSIDSVTNDQTSDVFPVGETIVTWKAKDIHGNVQTATQKVTVTNAEPVINSVTASASPVAVNREVVLTTEYIDNNVRNATVDWGDLSAPETITGPEDTFELSHTYSAAGTYSVTVTVTDHCDASAAYLYELVVVSEKGGAVSGDGWFHSKPGYYLKNKRASGKAQFHFDAKYKNGSEKLTGNISFKFKDGNLEFKSTDVESLVVEGRNAVLKGSGKVNGSRGYKILIAVADSDKKYDDKDHDKKDKHDKWDDDDPWGRKGRDDDKKDKHDKKDRDDDKKDKHDKKDHDDDKKDKHKDGNDKKDKDRDHSKKQDRIRVKIWDPSGKVVYDTQPGEPDEAIAKTDIGGGSIKVEQPKSGFNRWSEDDDASGFGEESISAYPNPFTEWVNVQYNSPSKENVVVQLMDLSGRVIASGVYHVSNNGSYSLDIPKNTRAGIYVLVIRQGKRVEMLRVVRK